MSDLTEQDIYTAFGIEQQQDVAASGKSDEFQPEAETSREQSSDEAEATNEGDAPEQEEQTPEAEEAKPEQSVEERRANAARRREKERKEAVDKAVAAEREKLAAEKQSAVDAVYQKLGYENEADYLRKQAEEQEKLRGRALKRLGLSEEEGTALFGQRNEAPAPEPATPMEVADDEPFQGGADALDRQIAEIGKLDPSIKSLADLQAKPWAAEMAQALNARQFGTDEGRLVRAYKVYAQEDIIQARLAEARKAGRQEALNQQAGKEHLAPAKERAGQGLPEVPKATLAAYKQLMPNLTYEQYQKEYAKTLKATK